MARKRTGASLFLIELLLGIAIFSFVAAICVRMFALSVQKSQESVLYSTAIIVAQNAAEQYKAGATGGYPTHFDRNGNAKEDGELLVAIETVGNENGIVDALATVQDEEMNLIYSLPFSYEEGRP